LNNTKGGNSDDATDDILRAEWAKSRARAARASEEVLLLHEEMRRVILFLRWKSKWWRSQEARRDVDTTLHEGLKAYAIVQANLQDILAADFLAIWKKPLDDEGDEGEDSSDDDDSEEEGSQQERYDEDEDDI
jgi:hypothetical protein